MRSLSPVIKPFLSAANSEAWLRTNSLMEITPQGSDCILIEADSTRRLEPSEMKSSKVGFRFSETAGALDDFLDTLSNDLRSCIEGEESSARFQIWAVSPYLKRSALIKDYNLTSLSEVGDFIPLESALFKCIHNGFNLKVQILLSEAIPLESGKPWRKGTILSEVIFRVRNTMDGIGFTPRSLTEEIRTQFHLGPGVTRFLRLTDETTSITQGEIVDDVLEFYVDEDLLQNKVSKFFCYALIQCVVAHYESPNIFCKAFLRPESSSN